MPAGLGYAFDPGAGLQGNAGGQGENGGFSRLSPQQAVKLLSLRIPERASPSAIAPQALLQGKGSAGLPMNSVIQGLMQAFMPGLQSGSTPTPHVIPGYRGGGAQTPPQIAATNVPPNADDILSQYETMVPGGGFFGGTPQGQAYQGAGQGMAPQMPAYLQRKQDRQDGIQPLF